MKVLRKLREENGSITMTVVTAMLFITSSILIAYFSLSNLSNDQSRKIRQVADSYKVTNSDLVQKYKETYDKSPDHTEVSYIQANYKEQEPKTQYIDTKFKPDSNSKIILKIKTKLPIANNSFLFGSRYNGNKNQFGVFYSTVWGNNGYTGRFGEKEYRTNIAYTDKNNEIIEIELSRERFWIRAFNQNNEPISESYPVERRN